MVCDRCISVVQQELERFGLEPERVELGVAITAREFRENEYEQLAIRLEELGFVLIQDKQSVTVDKIKTIIIELVHQNDNALKINLSDHISTELHQDYPALSRLFSEKEHTTIEQYYIAQKIERVKELITYNELTINEIALLLNYSSTAHLSHQFRKVTGMSPREFRNRAERKALDKL